MSIVHDIEQGDFKLTSDVFDDFREALEVLYILANISGRIKFATAWPHAAHKILGEDLLRYDRDGTDDYEHRSVLEGEAETRRLEFLDILDTIEENSVSGGMLQIPFVKGVVENWGRDLSLYVYSTKIVNRFIAPPEVESVPVSAENPQGTISRFKRQEQGLQFTMAKSDEAIANVRPVAEKVLLSLGITEDEKEDELKEQVSITLVSDQAKQSADKADKEEIPEEKKE